MLSSYRSHRVQQGPEKAGRRMILSTALRQENKKLREALLTSGTRELEPTAQAYKPQGPLTTHDRRETVHGRKPLWWSQKSIRTTQHKINPRWREN